MGNNRKPIFANCNEVKMQEKRDNGGISKETKRRRASAMKIFDAGQALNDRPSLKELCIARDKAGLESDLQGFYESYYVSLDKNQPEIGDQVDAEDLADTEVQVDTGDDIDMEDLTDDDEEETNDVGEKETDDVDELETCQRPKGNTGLTLKSHFKMLIKEFTDDEFDISSKAQFPNFYVSIL